MELDYQSWEKLEAEFRVKACEWAKFQVERLKRFYRTENYAEKAISNYRQLVDASTSASEFEQQWKRSIGEVGKEDFMALEFKELSRMFRKPHRVIHAAMAGTRAELRFGPKLLRRSYDQNDYEFKLDDIWNNVNNKELVIDHAVYALYVAWKPDTKIIVPDDRAKLLRSLIIDDSFLRVISPRRFEELIAYLYECFGCKVELTKQSRDFGADILAWHGGPLGSEALIAVQVKRYSSNRKVGLKGIFELHGALAHYHADLGHVVTTSDFTGPAKEFAKKQRIHLVDMSKLQEEVNSIFG